MSNSRRLKVRNLSNLLCAACLYTRKREAEAVTIVGGTALCYEHLGFRNPDYAVTSAIMAENTGTVTW